MDHGIDDPLRNLGAAWSIEKNGSHALARTVQGGELLAEKVDIEHGNSPDLERFAELRGAQRFAGTGTI
jgi:hypothetical protein